MCCVTHVICPDVRGQALVERKSTQKVPSQYPKFHGDPSPEYTWVLTGYSWDHFGTFLGTELWVLFWGSSGLGYLLGTVLGALWVLIWALVGYRVRVLFSGNLGLGYFLGTVLVP